MHRSHRSARRLVSALAVVTVGALALVPMAAATASTSPSPSPVASGAAADVTFTVGISQDVDSLNPFKGIVAEAYEMWGLMYDHVDRLQPGRLLARPRAGRVVGGVR